jgi:hypothetical protein
LSPALIATIMASVETDAVSGHHARWASMVRRGCGRRLSLFFSFYIDAPKPLFRLARVHQWRRDIGFLKPHFFFRNGLIWLTAPPSGLCQKGRFGMATMFVGVWGLYVPWSLKFSA